MPRCCGTAVRTAMSARTEPYGACARGYPATAIRLPSALRRLAPHEVAADPPAGRHTAALHPAVASAGHGNRSELPRVVEIVHAQEEQRGLPVQRAEPDMLDRRHVQLSRRIGGEGSGEQRL